MRVTLTSGDFTLAQECSSEVEAFECMAKWADLFSSMVCGVCGEKARFNFRVAQGYRFYSMQCTSATCRHELKFGQRQDDGGLFKKLKDQDGNYLANNGWVPPYQGGQRQQQRPQQDQYNQPANQAPQQQTLDDSEIPF